MTDESAPGGDRRQGRYEGFPDGFFTRLDRDDDRRFYGQPRLVQHIDDGIWPEHRNGSSYSE